MRETQVHNGTVTGRGESFVLAVTTRVYRSLFLFCVLVLVLYGLGNVQEFLDGNQLMLLAVVRGTSLAGTVLAGYCMGFRALLAVRRARHVGRSLALDALLFAANAALLVGVEMILAWLQVPAA